MLSNAGKASANTRQAQRLHSSRNQAPSGDMTSRSGGALQPQFTPSQSSSNPSESRTLDLINTFRTAQLQRGSPSIRSERSSQRPPLALSLSTPGSSSTSRPTATQADIDSMQVDDDSNAKRHKPFDSTDS